MTIQYTRSPLTEAVIEIRIAPPKSVSMDMLASVRLGCEDGYPNVQKRFAGEVELAVGETLVASGEGQQTGFVFVSTDQRHVVHVGLDTFSFSRLAPYESWGSFKEGALSWWRRYCGTVQPENVKRVAVRYINRLVLPLPMNDFKDYLRTYPEIAPDLPQGVSGYFMQLHIPQDEYPTMLILNQAIADVNDDSVSVILDIDLFREVDIVLNDEHQVWSLLDWFRVRKNEIFEKCITDKTRGLIT